MHLDTTEGTHPADSCSTLGESPINPGQVSAEHASNTKLQAPRCSRRPPCVGSTARQRLVSVSAGSGDSVPPREVCLYCQTDRETLWRSDPPPGSVRNMDQKTPSRARARGSPSHTPTRVILSGCPIDYPTLPIPTYPYLQAATLGWSRRLLFVSCNFSKAMSWQELVARAGKPVSGAAVWFLGEGSFLDMPRCYSENQHP